MYVNVAKERTQRNLDRGIMLNRSKEITRALHRKLHMRIGLIKV